MIRKSLGPLANCTTLFEKVLNLQPFNLHSNVYRSFSSNKISFSATYYNIIHLCPPLESDSIPIYRWWSWPMSEEADFRPIKPSVQIKLNTRL